MKTELLPTYDKKSCVKSYTPIIVIFFPIILFIISFIYIILTYVKISNTKYEIHNIFLLLRNKTIIKQ